MALKDWSETAANNDDADAAINWAEGQAPSTVNGSARSMMAVLKKAIGHVISIRDWGAVGDGVTDDGAAIQAALDYAETLLPSSSTQPDGFPGYSYGSVKVTVPAGRYASTTALAIPPHIVLEGDGSGSTVISFSYDGSCVTVKSGGSYPSHSKHVRIANITFRGNRTKTSQIVLDLTRFSWSEMQGVDVDSSGTDGIKLTECLSSTFTKCRSNGNVGVGWNLVESAGPLPCNANTFTQCEGFENDGEGLVIDGAFGNRWFGGTFENNFASSTYATLSATEVVVMRQVRITGIARGNKLIGTWLEGECNSLVYVDSDAANNTQFNSIVECTLIPKGTSGNTDRAVVVNKGHLAIVNPNWQASGFRTIGGSTAPFRIGKTNTGRIYLTGVLQTGVGPDVNLLVEDKDGADANLTGLAIQDLMNGATRLTYGRHEHYIEHGQVGQDWYKTASSSSTDWEEFPFLRVDAANRGLSAGDGTAAPDTIWRRSAANTWKTDDRVALANFINFSDGDTTPSVAGGNYFGAINTTPTTITAFDDGVAGQEITIVFTTSNTTVTDGGTLLLAGAFSSTPSDTLTLVFDGSNWYEKCRSAN